MIVVFTWISSAFAGGGLALTGGLVAGGPGGGVAAHVDHVASVVFVDQADEELATARVLLQADLTVAAHDRGYGSHDLVVGTPTLLGAAVFGRKVGVGPAVRVDALVGGAEEQYVSTGFGSRYSAIVEGPFLATAYPGVGVAVVADHLTASLTAGLPFWSFDVVVPTAPTPAVSWSTRSGWLLGARATRYQATLEVGRRL